MADSLARKAATPMRVLVACEFSGVVREAFRRKGHDAWSCDLMPAKDSSPYHIQGDVLDWLHGPLMPESEWDLMIAHPPCTYISNMSNCRINQPGRAQLRRAGMEFFRKLADAHIPRKAVENPRGLPEREYRKPDQIIQPWMFGHAASKATCLWLTNLPKLKGTCEVAPERKWDGKRWRTWVDRLPSSSPRRSVTFQGIADAMADQWGAERILCQTK